MTRPRASKIIVLLFIGLIVLALIPFRTDTTWIDPVTGTLKRQTSWLGISRDPVIDPSAIERWIVHREGPHVRSWRRVSATQWTFFGQGLSVSCSEPPMFLLRVGDFNDRLVQTLTDEQIARFVQIMRSGSESEQRVAIHVAYASVASNP